MTLGSLFDGIAGFPLAAQRQGITPVWGSEIETDCIDISAKHFPDMQQLGRKGKMAEKQRLSESDTIILSLHDRWWGKVLAGEKQLDIRKTRPAGKGPYRVLVYVTGTGEIKGEFVCKDFLKIPTIQEVQDREVQKKSCLTGQQLKEYAGESGKPLWGWYVSQVKEYYTPHKLSLYGLKRPPQSWQYYRGEDVPDIMTIKDGIASGAAKESVNFQERGSRGNV